MTTVAEVAAYAASLSQEDLGSQIPCVRVAIYVRVSSKEQVKGYGLAAQIYNCEKHVEQHKPLGWEIVGVYRDEGVSGVLYNRPGLERLERDMAAGRIDVVLVYKLDRIGRKHETFWRWVWKLDKYKVQLAAVVEKLDASSAQGRFMLKQYEAIAEIEREVIRTRTVEGLNAKLRRGGWPGGTTPWGFRIENKGEHNSEIVIDDGERGQQWEVRVAYDLLVKQRLGNDEAAQVMSGMGIRGRDGAVLNGKYLLRRMRADALRGFVIYRDTNRKYGNRTQLDRDGSPLYGPTTVINLPRIFTDDEIEELDRVLGAPKQISGRADYPLSGRIIGLCGGHYIGRRSHTEQWAYYYCSGRRDGEPCGDKNIRVDDIEPQVWQHVLQALRDEDYLHGLLQDFVGTVPDERSQYTDRVAEFDRQITEQERAIDKVVQSFAVLGLDPETAKRNIKTLQDELASIKKVRETAAKQLVALEDVQSYAENMERLIKLAQERAELLDADIQREILELLGIRVQLLGPVPGHIIGKACKIHEWFRATGISVPLGVSDAQWERIAEVLKASERTTPKTLQAARLSLELGFRKARTGEMWKDLEVELAGMHQSTAVTRFKRWMDGETWPKIIEAMGEYEGVPAHERVVLPPLRITGFDEYLAELQNLDAEVSRILGSSKTRSLVLT